MQTIETVAVLGGADEGHALALVAALAGCAVRVWEADAAAWERFRRRVDLAVAKGALTQSERQRVLDGVLFTPELPEAATGADLAADLSPGPADLARLAAAAREVRATAVLAVVVPPAASPDLPQPGRLLTIALEVAPAAGPLPRVSVAPLPSTTGHALERAAHLADRLNRAARHLR
jgi:hypothetical protein